MSNTVEDGDDNLNEYVASVRQRRVSASDERENTNTSSPDILLQDSIERSVKYVF